MKPFDTVESKGGPDEMNPFPFQEHELQRLSENNWTGLLNIEMSGGKTPMGVWAVQRSGAKVSLVVAPQPTHESAWIPTFESIAGVTPRVIGNGKKAEKAAMEDFQWGEPGVYLVTPQLLTRTDTSLWSGDMLVLDEALALDTRIPTPTGWTTVGELAPGDWVLGAKGFPVQVKSLTPIKKGRTFELTTDRGHRIVADAGHKWIAAPRVNGGTGYLKDRQVTTEEMFSRRVPWRIAPAEPVELPDVDLPVDPYVLGQWLGNGNRNQRYLTVRKDLLEDSLSEFISRGYNAYPTPSQDRDKTVRVSLGRRFVREMENLGVYDTKNPPGEYLRGSLQQRADLLRGLMDTDGYTSGTGLTFTNTNESLISGVSEVARTLGFVVSPPKTVQDNPHTVKTCYRVYFSGSGVVSPFLLRGGEYRPPRRGPASHRIVSIREVDPVEVRCIEVESEDHLFLAGEHMIPTHNCHLVSNPGKKGQKKIGGYGANLRSGDYLAARFEHRIALSGTALRNKFQLAWGTARFLWPEEGGAGAIADENHYRWLEQNMAYTEVYTNQRDHMGNPKKVKVYDVEKEPGKLFSRMPMVASHFRRENCCQFHPNGFMSLEKPTVVNEVLPLTAKQRKAIQDMETLSVTFLEDNPMVAELPLTQALRIRQMILGEPTVTWDYDDNGEEVQTVSFADSCKSPVLDRTIELMNNDLDGENVVIFTSSQKFAEVGVKRLNAAGIPAFEFSGVTRATRDELLKEFGTTYRAVVVVLAAGSTGLDGLQKVAKTEIWWDRDLDETTNEQARGRVDRLGGIGQVMRIQFHDDLGILEGKYSEALAKRLELNRSLRSAA